MAFHIRDPETDRIVRELAAKTGQTLTETVKQSCAKVLAKSDDEVIAKIIKRIDGYLEGVEIDYSFDEKAYLDEMWGHNDVH